MLAYKTWISVYTFAISAFNQDRGILYFVSDEASPTVAIHAVHVADGGHATTFSSFAQDVYALTYYFTSSHLEVLLILGNLDGDDILFSYAGGSFRSVVNFTETDMPQYKMILTAAVTDDGLYTVVGYDTHSNLVWTQFYLFDPWRSWTKSFPCVNTANPDNLAYDPKRSGYVGLGYHIYLSPSLSFFTISSDQASCDEHTINADYVIHDTTYDPQSQLLYFGGRDHTGSFLGILDGNSGALSRHPTTWDLVVLEASFKFN